jgi:hypothetical protein
LDLLAKAACATSAEMAAAYLTAFHVARVTYVMVIDLDYQKVTKKYSI